MNKKRIASSTVIALVVLLANVLAVMAHPAEQPDVTPAQSVTAACVRASYASSDIPSSRVDYMLLDGATRCPVVAATSIKLIPSTGGRQTGYADLNFKAFKERQSEMGLR